MASRSRAEDFRYYWEDVANNRELSPSGRRATCWSTRGAEVRGAERDDPALQLVEAQPAFPAAHGGSVAAFIFRPAHYLRQFHKKILGQGAEGGGRGTGKRRWSAVHNRWDNLYEATTRTCRRSSPGTTRRGRRPIASLPSGIRISSRR